VFLRAEQDGNAVPVVAVSETLRLVKQDESEPINRENYRMIQTPQCFHSDLLKRAYQQDYKDSFTDDATVVETLGIKINLVEGNRENIKITHPGDLKFAEALLK
jgi:2-C-methyl-D-erythritol 4-phosphate cytidylyltransferase